MEHFLVLISIDDEPSEFVEIMDEIEQQLREAEMSLEVAACNLREELSEMLRVAKARRLKTHKLHEAAIDAARLAPILPQRVGMALARTAAISGGDYVRAVKEASELERDQHKSPAGLKYAATLAALSKLRLFRDELLPAFESAKNVLTEFPKVLDECSEQPLDYESVRIKLTDLTRQCAAAQHTIHLSRAQLPDTLRTEKLQQSFDALEPRLAALAQRIPHALVTLCPARTSSTTNKNNQTPVHVN